VTFSVPETRLDTVIIRLAGEIGIKAAWTRKLYERCLIKNIKAALKLHVIPYEAINRRFGRLYLETSQTQRASERLAGVFGVSSLSPALQTTSRLSDVVKRSVSLAGQKLRRGDSFAVRCKRTGRHAYTSTEVCREVGRRILGAFLNLHLRVDLKDPDVTIGIEIRDEQAFIFTDVIEGMGGLPLGTQPKVVCLLDEDANSSVACWLVMKRGCPVLLLHFDNSPFSNEEATELTLDAARTLFKWAAGFPRRVYVVPNGQNLAEIQPRCPEELTQIVSRRLMYRIAERVAETKGAEGIVSGESLGEPPAQKLKNIRLLDEAVKLYPIHRPLLGLVETEVKQLAKKIEVHEALLMRARRRKRVLGKAVRTVTLGDVEAAERKLNVDRMVEVSLKSLRVVSLRRKRSLKMT